MAAVTAGPAFGASSARAGAPGAGTARDGWGVATAAGDPACGGDASSRGATATIQAGLCSSDAVPGLAKASADVTGEVFGDGSEAATACKATLAGVVRGKAAAPVTAPAVPVVIGGDETTPVSTPSLGAAEAFAAAVVSRRLRSGFGRGRGGDCARTLRGSGGRISVEAGTRVSGIAEGGEADCPNHQRHRALQGRSDAGPAEAEASGHPAESAHAVATCNATRRMLTGK